MGGGIGLPFCWVALETAQLGTGDERHASGVTPVGWEGATAKYPMGVVVQGIGPFGWEGPGLRSVAPVGWEGITVVVQGRQACWRWALGIVPTG